MGEIADSIVGEIVEIYGTWTGRLRSKPSCNKCGSKNVYWFKYPSGKYFLFDKDTKQAHVCNPNKIKESPEINYISTCYTCDHYFIGGRCIKHGISTGHSYTCRNHSDKE